MQQNILKGRGWNLDQIAHFNLADEKSGESIEARLVVWLVSIYDECRAACFMMQGLTLYKKSQLIDRALEQYMEVIDSVPPLI